jgi:hypothetical protein
MDDPLTDLPQARVIFSAHASMRYGYVGVVQCGNKKKHR